ncbi:MAG TPA: DUF1800 family protein [Acidimicrobiia bacterium]|nr:DUF1800 family protein [Acidimicrobiia bacterium]
MGDDRAALAHLLRRTGFGPFPGQVEALNPGGLAAALDGVLAATPPPLPADPVLDGSGGIAPPAWWLQRMRDPAAGLHEKMVWFWHGHFTSSVDKVGSWQMMWNQHLLLRQHALGNFRTMALQMTIDPAMLIYLDGDPSEAIDPNENYSRELQELFTIGVDNVTEPNVKAGAKALAGWEVDWSSATAVFRPYAAISTPVTFLGRSCLRYDDVVNAAVDHPACAPFVAAKVHRYFHGVDLTPARKAELGDLFRSNNMEILPLVTAILRDPSFFDPSLRMNRPRYPVEWASAAFAAIGNTDVGWEQDIVDNMGQLPFSPPNVAGWPSGSKWLAANVAVLRAQVGNSAPVLTAIRNAADPVQAALQQCSIYEVSQHTLDALTNAAASISTAGRRAATLLGLVISSPEMALA